VHFFFSPWFSGHAALARLKEEKGKCSISQDPPTSEEFMPPKTISGGKENERCEKKNWMSSAQLWSTQKIKSVILS